MRYFPISYLLILVLICLTNPVLAQQTEESANSSNPFIDQAMEEYNYALENEASPYYLQQLSYNVAALNQNYGNYDEAFKYHKKRLNHILADTSFGINMLASAYNNLGSIERLRENYRQSESYLNSVDLTHPNLDPRQKNFIIVNYSNLYLAKNMPLKAKEKLDPIYDEMIEELKDSELMLTDLKVFKLEIEYVIEPTELKLAEIEELLDHMVSEIGEESPFAEQQRKRLDDLKAKLQN